MTPPSPDDPGDRFDMPNPGDPGDPGNPSTEATEAGELPAQPTSDDPSDTAAETPPGRPPGDAATKAPVDFHELHDTGEGDGLIRADAWATAAFTVVAVLAVAFPDAFVPVFVPLSLLLFLAGCVAFVWAFVRGVGRSRYEAVMLGELFFLTGDVAPVRVRQALRGLFAAQVVVAVAAAFARPFTPLAFGTLVPIFGLGLIALWGARYGEFSPKEEGGQAQSDPQGRGL